MSLTPIDHTLAMPTIMLLHAGVETSSAMLSRAWHRGDVIRVARGVYADSAAWRELRAWERYLARVHAVAAANPDAIFCGPSSAALRGAQLGRANAPICILNPQGTSRTSNGIRVVTSDDQRRVECVDGILLTSTEDTIIDLARTESRPAGLAYADALLRRDRGARPEKLRALNEARLSSRNRDRARWALERATGIPESVLESLSLAVIELGGFELPDLQVEFSAEGPTDRADFYWRSRDVIGEADGDVKYSGELADPTEAIRKEKLREARLRRQVSSHLRWGWGEYTAPDRLLSMLDRTGIPRIAAPDGIALAGIRAGRW